MSATPNTGGSVGSEGLIPEMYLDYMKQVLTPYLVAEKCFDRFFVNFDFFDGKLISSDWDKVELERDL